jgi:hypothetical protein
MPRGLLVHGHPSGRPTDVRASSLLHVLNVAAYGSWAVGLVLFVNGLTSPEANAKVFISGADAVGPTLANGWLSGSSATGVFHFGEIYTASDRIGTRLELVALFGTVGLFCWALGALLSAHRASGFGGLQAASRAWTSLAAAALCAGLVVPFAAWAQSATVLDLAGRPEGLTPVASIGWGWLTLAAAIWAQRLMLRRTPVPSARATEARD